MSVVTIPPADEITGDEVRAIADAVAAMPIHRRLEFLDRLKETICPKCGDTFNRHLGYCICDYVSPDY